MRIRKILLLGAVCAGIAVAASAESRKAEINEFNDPIYEISAGYIPDSGFGSRERNESAVLEIGADWNIAFYRPSAGSEIEIGLKFSERTFFGKTWLSLPDQVAAIAVDLEWVAGYSGDKFFKLGFEPGIYSDLEDISGKSMFVPVSLSFGKKFRSDFSGEIGLQVRPQFDRQLIPLVGIDWAITDKVEFELAFPESRFDWYFGDGWNVNMCFMWDNVSYRLEGDTHDRGLITFEEMRYSGGIGRRIASDLHIGVDVGRIAGRKVEFENAGGLERSIDVEDALFGRIFIAGPY